MKLENRTIHVPLAGQGMWLSVLSRAVAHELGHGAYPLRLSIAEVRDRTALAEVTVLSLTDDEARRYGIDGAALLAPRRKEWQAGRFAVVNVVPTGVRC
jgi:predicted nucleic acid-binding protein